MSAYEQRISLLSIRHHNSEGACRPSSPPHADQDPGGRVVRQIDQSAIPCALLDWARFGEVTLLRRRTPALHASRGAVRGHVPAGRRHGPARTANISGHGPRSPARDRTITWVKQLGRRRWKKASGYHRQGRVENTFFRYKSIIGDGLRARSPAGQVCVSNSQFSRCIQD